MKGFSVKSRKLFLSIIIIIVLIVLIVICEDSGLVPGKQIADLSTRIFMSSKHKNVEYIIENISYNKKTMKYEVNCISQGKKYQIIVKSMKVYEDGYFNNFLRDDDLEKIIKQTIIDKLSPILSQKVDVFKKIDVKIIIPKDKYSIDIDINNISEKSSIYIDLQGKKITEQEHRKLTYLVKNTILSEGGIKPEFLQVFYYRENGLDNEKIMQFESQFTALSMELSEEQTLNSKNVHKIVELTPEQEKKIKNYYMFKNFYYITIIVTVVGLSGFAVYKKLKR